MLRGQWFENDVIVLFVNDRACAPVDFKIFPQPTGNHDLPFHSEHHGVGFWSWSHNSEYYLGKKSKSNGFLLEIDHIVNLVAAKLFLHHFRRSSASPLHFATT